MNSKSFMFGLGIGIAFVSLVVLIFIKTMPAENMKQEPVIVDMTDEEILERAKELGMVRISDLPSKNELEDINLNEDELQDFEELENTEEKLEEPEKSVPEEYSQEIDGGYDEDNEEKIIETATIIISPGMNATSVAKLLYNEGLIDDAEAFKTHIVKTGYSTRIRSGTYEVPMGLTYDEIIELIRKRQK